jgi:hypothetical protein
MMHDGNLKLTWWSHSRTKKISSVLQNPKIQYRTRMESVKSEGRATYRNIIYFYDEGLFAPAQPLNMQDRPVFGRPRLLIQYIRSLRPSSEDAFICSPRTTPHVVAIMDPLHLRIKETAWQECTNRGGLHFVRRCVMFVGSQYEPIFL